jgi:hypothetical protein
MLPSATILPRDSELFRRLHQAAVERRCVFFAGLPGVGKSLLLQQLSLLAGEGGRRVHLLQWDVARGPFETPAILGRYPETDGVTDAVIRKAVGIWARGAVGVWQERHADRRDLLIGEVPLIGGRLIELVQRRDDPVEALLAGEGTVFLIPVPSREVRQVIEAARVREMASPSHERERANAVPSLVRALWEEVTTVARELGVDRPLTRQGPPTPRPPPPQAGEGEPDEVLAPPPRTGPWRGGEAERLHGREEGLGRGIPRCLASPHCASAVEGEGGTREQGGESGFDPEVYAGVYERLLRHRRAARLDVTTALPVQTSVYDALEVVSELMPTAEEVERVMAEVGARPEAEVEREVADWYRV